MESLATRTVERQRAGDARVGFVDRASARHNLAKRICDVAFSAIALICSAPILLAALILIPLQSKGWPIFVQRRVGVDGRIFKIYKLRTMVSGSDAYAFKTAPDDQRLTSIGRLLRKTNIDELPQLINVLLGDMSLIGPRPLSVEETDHICRSLHIDTSYPGLIPVVRPGLVGLEQVNRDRELTYFERFAYNFDYETNWSLSMDSTIFLRALSVCRDVCFAAGFGAVVLLVSYAIYMALA